MKISLMNSLLANRRQVIFNLFKSLTGYFPHIGRLNQLLVLCQQLEDDVQHLGSHKYIAHQLSVIYVSMKQHRPGCCLLNCASIERF